MQCKIIHCKLVYLQKYKRMYSKPRVSLHFFIHKTNCCRGLVTKIMMLYASGIIAIGVWRYRDTAVTAINLEPSTKLGSRIGPYKVKRVDESVAEEVYKDDVLFYNRNDGPRIACNMPDNLTSFLFARLVGYKGNSNLKGLYQDGLFYPFKSRFLEFGPPLMSHKFVPIKIEENDTRIKVVDFRVNNAPPPGPLDDYHVLVGTIQVDAPIAATPENFCVIRRDFNKAIQSYLGTSFVTRVSFDGQKAMAFALGLEMDMDRIRTVQFCYGNGEERNMQ